MAITPIEANIDEHGVAVGSNDELVGCALGLEAYPRLRWGCRDVEGDTDGVAGGGEAGGGCRLCVCRRGGGGGALVQVSASVLEQHPPWVSAGWLQRRRFGGVHGRWTMQPPHAGVELVGLGDPDRQVMAAMLSFIPLFPSGWLTLAGSQHVQTGSSELLMD